MAVLRYYWINQADPDSVRGMATSTTQPSAATTTTGWTVGKLAAPNYCELSYGQETALFSNGGVLPTATTTLGSVAMPDGLIGVFAAGNWTVKVEVIAVSSGGDQDGRFNARLIRRRWNPPNPSPTSVHISTALGTSNTITNLTTTVSQIATITIPCNSVEIVYPTSEWIWLAIAWEITGAGGNNSRDVLVRVGANTYIETTDFSQSISASGSVGTVNVTAPTGSAQVSDFEQYRLKLMGVGK